MWLAGSLATASDAPRTGLPAFQRMLPTPPLVREGLVREGAVFGAGRSGGRP